MIRFFRRAIHFAIAWMRWRLAGRPKRTPDMVKILFYCQCKPCVHYHPDLEECTICECYVRPDYVRQNKLIYQTERCPLEKW